MSTYIVEVELVHQDTQRRVTTWVTVQAPYAPDWDATLTAAQLATAHRVGWMPVKTRIIGFEA